MQLPSNVPVMVLPNAVLFPQAMLPLRIFEPRYRQMLADCLETDRIFSIALMKRGWEKSPNDPPAYEIAGLGIIRASAEQPDGTSHLLLQGVARAQIVQYRQQHPYRIAQVEILETNHADNVQVDALAAKVAELIQSVSKLGLAPPQPLLKHLVAQSDAEHLTDLASDLLLADCHAKQKLLETLDLRERLRQLIGYLQHQIERMGLLKELQSPTADEPFGAN